MQNFISFSHFSGDIYIFLFRRDSPGKKKRKSKEEKTVREVLYQKCSNEMSTHMHNKEIKSTFLLLNRKSYHNNSYSYNNNNRNKHSLVIII
jgi:hypothetical protein